MKKGLEHLRQKLKNTQLIKKFEPKQPVQSSSPDEHLTSDDGIPVAVYEPAPTKNIRDFQKEFLAKKKVGEGSNGYVKLCVYLETNTQYAVKFSSFEEQHLLSLKRQFRSISTLNHPCIVKYHSMYLNLKERQCRLVMEYVPHPTLATITNLQHEQIKDIVRQLLEILVYLRSRRICHRDIKPQNILYDRANRKICLIDFGVSKMYMLRGHRREMTTNTGTIDYKAPEVLDGGGYTESVDMWAVGVVLYQLVSGQRPFSYENHIDTVEHIRNIDYDMNSPIWLKISHHVKVLIREILKPSHFRITPNEALKYFWFDGKTSKSPLFSSGTLNVQFKWQPESDQIRMNRNNSFEIPQAAMSKASSVYDKNKVVSLEDLRSPLIEPPKIYHN